MLRYSLKIDGKLSGPHSVPALQEMAALRAFDEATPIAPELTEDWKPVREIPELNAVLFPPRKAIQLKAKVFESIPQIAEPASVSELLRGNLDAEAKNPPSPRFVIRRPNRRLRDFLTAAILFNLIGGAGVYFLPHNHVITVSLGSYFAIINLGLYWLFYQIMDRY